MWFLEEREKLSQPRKAGLLLTTGVEYVVGRKDCTVLIQDDASISRKHSIITLNHDESNLGDPSKMSQVSLEDFSKYGTFVNGARISGFVTLKNGDEILFGKNHSYFKLRCSPLVVVTSCLEEKKKKTLKGHIHRIGGHMINDWRPNITSHLVMDGLTFTIKVIHALAECCPIVTPSYFEDIVNPTSPSSALEKIQSYLPPLKEETIRSQGESFLPREARRTLFQGKTFIFISKKQFKRVHHAVESSGGMALLKDTPGSESDNGLVSEDVCVMMMDNKEQNALSAESLQWVLHVMETLKRQRRRPIPESELGLALLFISLEKYCNPSITAVPPLTQNLVSQSFQAADVMSQQIVAPETQFKKLSHPVKLSKDDRTQDVTSQKQNLACTTAQKSSQTVHLGKRCTNEDNGVESIPDSQTSSQEKPPSTKRRKLLEAEAPFASESLHPNKTLNWSHSYMQLELADSIVADSFQIVHGNANESNGQPKGKDNHEMLNKVENIADSLDVSTDSQMAVSETRACEGKQAKTVQGSKFLGAEVAINSITRQTEEESRNKNNELAHKNENEQMKEMPEFRVPAGFLCSRIPRKLARNTVFEDESAHLPRNLVVVNHVSLVVQPSVASPAVKNPTEITTTRNFKKFLKQFYPGSRTSLPRIIGGSDLVVHQSNELLDKDDWFLEARQADAERQKEERMAEELFRWEERPPKSKRTKR